MLFDVYVRSVCTYVYNDMLYDTYTASLVF